MSDPTPRAPQLPYRTLFVCAALGLVVSVAAFHAAAHTLTDSQGKIVETLGGAGITLIFVGVIGGFLGLNFNTYLQDRIRHHQEDATRRETEHEAKAARETFHRAMLADLKSVHDTVETARLLIEAHKSAKTYGEQMRALNDALTTLYNVKRAPRPSYPDLEEALKEPMLCCIGFLRGLLAEYREEYKEASDLQGAYEARKQAYFQAIKDLNPNPPDYPDLNTVWEHLKGFEELEILRAEYAEAHYIRRFVIHVDAASHIIRRELPDARDSASENAKARSRIKDSADFCRACKTLRKKSKTAALTVADVMSSGAAAVQSLGVKPVATLRAAPKGAATD